MVPRLKPNDALKDEILRRFHNQREASFTLKINESRLSGFIKWGATPSQAERERFESEFGPKLTKKLFDRVESAG